MTPPDRIWLVIWPNQLEPNFITREPLEGIAAWSKGTDATVIEYQRGAVVHTPPKKETT